MNYTVPISQLLNEIRQIYTQEQIDKGLRASGESARSLRTEATATEGRLYGAKYFYQQIHGRRPGKFPPISAILEWIKIKGIKARESSTTERQLAFLFARKIAKQGTDIFQGKKAGLEVDQKVREASNKFTASLNELIKADISQSMKKI